MERRRSLQLSLPSLLKQLLMKVSPPSLIQETNKFFFEGEPDDAQKKKAIEVAALRIESMPKDEMLFYQLQISRSLL